MPAFHGHCFYFGTFNPIHTGHLMIAQSALCQFGSVLEFERITFMPAGNPPHRHHQNDLLDAALRLKMARLATAQNPAFAVSDFELSLPHKNYTVETLCRMQQANLITLPVPFIIGSDALASLGTWHQPAALIDRVHFLQAPRPGHDWVNHVFIDGQKRTLNTSRIQMPLSGISATHIRHLLGQSPPPSIETLRYSLPESVRHFIHWNQLYATSKNPS